MSLVCQKGKEWERGACDRVSKENMSGLKRAGCGVKVKSAASGGEMLVSDGRQTPESDERHT